MSAARASLKISSKISTAAKVCRDPLGCQDRLTGHGVPAVYGALAGERVRAGVCGLPCIVSGLQGDLKGAWDSIRGLFQPRGVGSSVAGCHGGR